LKKVKGKVDDKTPDEAASKSELVAPLTWAQRLKLVFNIDIAMCPFCGGALRLPFILKLARINRLKLPWTKIKTFSVIDTTFCVPHEQSRCRQWPFSIHKLYPQLFYSKML